MKTPITISPQSGTSDTLMQRIAITGGIGSGKSYICKQLQAAGHHIFYCDDEAKHIIRTHPDVMRELRQLVGDEVYDAEGKLVKSVLAAYLCRGAAYSHQVDAIVHPRVAEAFVRFCQAHGIRPTEESVGAKSTVAQSWEEKVIALNSLQSLSPAHTVFMECALLFESGFNRLVDHTVLVHVSHATQTARLMARDHISQEKAQAWMNLQLPEERKLQLADAVIVNE